MTRSTYDKLVLAAYRRFCRYGMKGLKINDITQDIGMTKGAFYKPGFQVTKNQLLKDVFDYGLQETKTYLAELRAAKNVEDYRAVLLRHEDTADYGGKLLLIVVDEFNAPYVEEFQALFVEAVVVVSNLMGRTKAEKKKYLDLVPPIARDTLANHEDLKWEERIDLYLRRLINVQTL